MAEVLALFCALLGLEIVFSGLLMAWWLRFPAAVERARLRLDRTPWQCFGLGCVTVFISLPPIVTLLILPLEQARIVGCLLLFIVLAFAALGAAGLAVQIGERLAPRAGDGAVPGAALTRRGLVLELAAGFWLGGVTTVILLPAIAVLLALSLDLTWLVGSSLVFVVLAFAGLGAAFLAARRSGRRVPHGNKSVSHTAAFVRGAVALELSAGFPITGWFIVAPLAFITALGATVFALLRWMPGEASAAGRDTRTKSICVSFIALLWVLPLVVISVSVVAFFVRGAVALELASSLPVVGWFIIVPLYIIVALGSTVFALLRWGGWWRRPLSAGRGE
ncbi:MAG: hypothetical protein V3S51_00665 [Dehalococcoidia bacterium]